MAYFGQGSFQTSACFRQLEQYLLLPFLKLNKFIAAHFNYPTTPADLLPFSRAIIREPAMAHVAGTAPAGQPAVIK